MLLGPFLSEKNWYHDTNFFAPITARKVMAGGGFEGITVIPKMYHDTFAVVPVSRSDTMYHRPTFRPFLSQK
jgi:hypothetical protein